MKVWGHPTCTKQGFALLQITCRTVGSYPNSFHPYPPQPVTGGIVSVPLSLRSLSSRLKRDTLLFGARTFLPAKRGTYFSWSGTKIIPYNTLKIKYLELFCQKGSCFRFFVLYYCFGTSFDDYFSTFVSAARTHIDNPVCTFNHVHVVFNNQN